MATKTIKLEYLSAAGFLQDCAQLQKGRFSIPAGSPLPSNSGISLKISVPDVDRELMLQGTVIKILTRPNATRLNKPGVMIIGFNKGSQNAIRIFKYTVSNHVHCSASQGWSLSVGAKKTGPHGMTMGGNSVLPLNWIRTALAQKKAPAEKKAAARYLANTAKMAADVKTNVRYYVNRILQVKSTEDAVVLLNLFRRVLQTFVKQADWKIVLYLTRAVDKAAKTTVFFAAATGLPANPLELAFKNRICEIVTAYAKADASHRQMINEIVLYLDTLGIEIMARTLSSCKDCSMRKAVLAALLNKGGLARSWILGVLDAPGQKWYLKRTALMLLKFVGKKENEIDRARKLVDHEHPAVRIEALNVLITLQASGAGDLVIAALDDADDNVRRRAVNGLSELAPISEASIRKLLDRIVAKAPADKEEAGRHYRRIADLIKALGAMPHVRDHVEVEATILDIARSLSNQRKGLLKRLTKYSASDQSVLLSAAVSTLGNIGTTRSETFLEKLAGNESPQAEMAQKAANNIRLRYIALLSNAPDDADMLAVA